jgi:hypothetical protein
MLSSVKKKKKKVWIFPSKTSFLLWEWRVLIIWFGFYVWFRFRLYSSFYFVFSHSYFFNLFCFIITSFCLLFFILILINLVVSKISMPPFLTVGHQPRSWGTFEKCYIIFILKLWVISPFFLCPLLGHQHLLAVVKSYHRSSTSIYLRKLSKRNFSKLQT